MSPPHFPLLNTFSAASHHTLADQGLASQTDTSYVAAVRNMPISIWTAGPEGLLLPSYPEESPGGNQEGEAREECTLKNQATNNGKGPRADQDDVRPFISPTESTPPGSGLHGIFWLLRARGTPAGVSYVIRWGDVTEDNQTTLTKVRLHLKNQVRPVWLRGRYHCGSHRHPSLPSGSHCELHMVERGPRPGPFFIDTGGKVITKAQFVGVIRGVLGSIGLPQHQYAGQALGLGQRPQLHWPGVEDFTIQALGRCHSATFLKYIRMPKESLASVSCSLAAQV